MRDEATPLLATAQKGERYYSGILGLVVIGSLLLAAAVVVSPQQQQQQHRGSSEKNHVAMLVDLDNNPPDYVFELELVYAALQLDGKEKMVLSFNGHGVQGPTMRVPTNATVRVDVINSLPDQGLTVHFHGIHQRGTPYYDGALGL
ncbi:MAG: multicopper oxidase domain-containing protein, partial [Planctomycetota bacterium]